MAELFGLPMVEENTMHQGDVEISTWQDIAEQRERERDELRAENERLNAVTDELARVEKIYVTEIEERGRTIERLRAALVDIKYHVVGVNPVGRSNTYHLNQALLAIREALKEG